MPKISKDLGDMIIFLKSTYPVDLKLNCKLKGMHQEILVLGLCGVFPNSTIALRICVSQWLHINTLSM
jgi:hypothetical protein